MQKIAEVLYVKVGKVQTTTLKSSKRKELVTAMKKHPVKEAFLTITGFKQDEQADLKHHGGENKALFMFSKRSYEIINQNCNTNFKVDEVANLGENLILSDVCEDDICVGDIFNIGEAQVQITQPRQPCWKLSASTKIKQMTKFIFNSGLTGWYAKVLKEGTIKQNDFLILIKREEPLLTISKLNSLILDVNSDKEATLKALSSQFLGKPFKASLEKRYNLGQNDKQFDIYHT
ncbi:MOSC domain-containing protein [Malaciobacter marinus]|uniref:MOSC domain-containing protein n=1 Tax=Malaciobacter marinus TaxID=505249 RepID=UPI003B004143